MEERILIEAVEQAEENEHLSEAEERVGPLELFFDLVFVFAITQVTAYIAKTPDWETARARNDDPRGGVVGVGRLLVADQHARHRDGTTSAS